MLKKIISFDVSSGDKGSEEAIKASIDFLEKNSDWKIIAFSNDEIKLKKQPNNLEIIYCKEKILQTDSALEIRRKKDSTLIRAINSVLEGKSSAVLSAAASGPLVTAGYLLFKTIEGIKPAFSIIASNIFGKLIIFLDVGANIGADSETLNKYAIMGSLFAKVMNISETPKVKLLNIGSEEKKGTQLQVDAFKLLTENKAINFKGNIEANQLLSDNNVDVIVTEAFSGNIALKSYEGASEEFKNMIKESMNESFKDKIGFFLTKKFIKKMKQSTNDEAGGAVVLGLNHLLIKAHGRSDSKLFFNSLNDTKKLIESNLIDEIKKI